MSRYNHKMAATKPDIMLHVVEKPLTDNSKVFNVHIGDLTLHACSRDDADKLVEAICRSITKHTVESAGYDWRVVP